MQLACKVSWIICYIIELESWPFCDPFVGLVHTETKLSLIVLSQHVEVGDLMGYDATVVLTFHGVLSLCV